MADRTVVYRLRAEASQFQAQMAAAGASARKAAGELGTTMTTNAGKASAALDSVGINAGTAAVAVGTTVVMAAANFDKAMSGVKAATHESAASMDALRQAALDAGAQTAFSATEAAAGIENLAKAGVSTADILDGGLSGALDLAAAGQLGVADASEIAATAMTQFKLSGEDVPHIADLLAAGAGKAQGEVSDLSMALKQSGLVASQMGVSIEETTGTLAAFASAGLLGSDAGTSLRTMLLRLANPSKESARLMQDLGINAYDAQGNFVGMASVAGQLQTAFEGKTQAERDSAMATIFGSDAIRAASVLYEQGAEGVATWTDNVNDAGYAAETAAIQMDNLRGDVEELKGALETAFIQGGEDSQGMLRGITQLATDTVNLTTEAEKADGVLGSLWSNASGAINPIGRLGGAYNGLKGELSDTKDESDDLAQSSTAAAGGMDAQAVSAEGLGGAIRATTEELEAQEKALKDARKAASETARGFVNLGAGVDDAKVSLGQWIKQMANQADALNNFMNNAKAASKRGLRDGLINDLQDAGTAGAMRMKQLANATDSEIARANQAWSRGQKAMRDYVNFKVPPKKIDVNTGEALTAVQIIKNALKNIPDENVTVRVTRAGTGAVSPGFGPQANAEGGFITGPGTGTSDSIPSYLSNGEYVIKAAAVDKYGVHMFDRLNAMHFADGGEVKKGDDKKKPRRKFNGAEFTQDTTAGLQRSIDRLSIIAEDQTGAVEASTRVYEEAAEETKRWADKMGEVAQATTSGFNTGLFERDSNPWASGAGGGWLSKLTKDIGGLEERGALQSQLAGMGLSGDALAALLGQGSNADISSLINSGQVSQYAALFNQRAALQGSVGAAAGSQAYGAQFAVAEKNAQRAQVEAERQTAIQTSMQTQILHQTAQLTQIEQLLANNPTDTGNAVGRALNGASAGAQRERNYGGPR